MLVAYKSMDTIPYDIAIKIGFWRVFINMSFYYIRGNVQILYMILSQFSYK